MEEEPTSVQLDAKEAHASKRMSGIAGMFKGGFMHRQSMDTDGDVRSADRPRKAGGMGGKVKPGLSSKHKHTGSADNSGDNPPSPAAVSPSWAPGSFPAGDVTDTLSLSHLSPGPITTGTPSRGGSSSGASFLKAMGSALKPKRRNNGSKGSASPGVPSSPTLPGATPTHDSTFSFSATGSSAAGSQSPSESFCRTAGGGASHNGSSKLGQHSASGDADDAEYGSCYSDAVQSPNLSGYQEGFYGGETLDFRQAACGLPSDASPMAALQQELPDVFTPGFQQLMRQDGNACLHSPGTPADNTTALEPTLALLSTAQLAQVARMHEPAATLLSTTIAEETPARRRSRVSSSSTTPAAVAAEAASAAAPSTQPEATAASAAGSAQKPESSSPVAVEDVSVFVGAGEEPTAHGEAAAAALAALKEPSVACNAAGVAGAGEVTEGATADSTPVAAAGAEVAAPAAVAAVPEQEAQAVAAAGASAAAGMSNNPVVAEAAAAADSMLASEEPVQQPEECVSSDAAATAASPARCPEVLRADDPVQPAAAAPNAAAAAACEQQTASNDSSSSAAIGCPGEATAAAEQAAAGSIVAQPEDQSGTETALAPMEAAPAVEQAAEAAAEAAADAPTEAAAEAAAEAIAEQATDAAAEAALVSAAAAEAHQDAATGNMQGEQAVSAEAATNPSVTATPAAPGCVFEQEQQQLATTEQAPEQQPAAAPAAAAQEHATESAAAPCEVVLEPVQQAAAEAADATLQEPQSALKAGAPCEKGDDASAVDAGVIDAGAVEAAAAPALQVPAAELQPQPAEEHEVVAAEPEVVAEEEAMLAPEASEEPVLTGPEQEPGSPIAALPAAASSMSPVISASRPGSSSRHSRMRESIPLYTVDALKSVGRQSLAVDGDLMSEDMPQLSGGPIGLPSGHEAAMLAGAGGAGGRLLAHGGPQRVAVGMGMGPSAFNNPLTPVAEGFGPSPIPEETSTGGSSHSRTSSRYEAAAAGSPGSSPVRQLALGAGAQGSSPCFGMTPGSTYSTPTMTMGQAGGGGGRAQVVATPASAVSSAVGSAIRDVSSSGGSRAPQAPGLSPALPAGMPAVSPTMGLLPGMDVSPTMGLLPNLAPGGANQAGGNSSTPSLLDARAASPSAVYACNLFTTTPYRGALAALPIDAAVNAPLVDSSPFDLTDTGGFEETSTFGQGLAEEAQRVAQNLAAAAAGMGATPFPARTPGLQQARSPADGPDPRAQLCVRMASPEVMDGLKDVYSSMLIKKVAALEQQLKEREHEVERLKSQVEIYEFEKTELNSQEEMEKQARQYAEEELTKTRMEVAEMRAAKQQVATQMQALREQFEALRQQAEARHQQDKEQQLMLQQQLEQVQADRNQALDKINLLDMELTAVRSTAMDMQGALQREQQRGAELEALLAAKDRDLADMTRINQDTSSKLEKAMEQMIAAQTAKEHARIKASEEASKAAQYLADGQQLMVERQKMLADRDKREREWAALKAKYVQKKTTLQELEARLHAKEAEVAELMGMCETLLAQQEAQR